MQQQVSIWNVVKLAGAYIAFTIGSGFATGQEVLQFFTSYGPAGYIGALVSMFRYYRRDRTGHYRVYDFNRYRDRSDQHVLRQ